jgi:hypothetical protein
MGCHFLMDRHRWTMAALHHFEAWEREEREIFARMVPRVTGEGIALAGAYSDDSVSASFGASQTLARRAWWT